MGATCQSIILQNKSPVILGRGPLTGIKLPALSRHQLEVVADTTSSKVIIKQVPLSVFHDQKKHHSFQLGPNPSTLNGKLLSKDTEHEAHDKDKVGLLASDPSLGYCLSIKRSGIFPD
jgi:hypothetical protein